MIEYFIISVLCSFGLAILLVEKGEDFPMSLFVPRIKTRLNDINPNIASVLDCTTCTSFWASLVVESILYLFYSYFLWPLSGFAVAGFTWLVIELLNAIDSQPPSGEINLDTD
jgi:hypothetical protein